MFYAESSTQWLLLLMESFGDLIVENKIKYIVFDRACELSPFIANVYQELQQRGAEGGTDVLKKL